MPIFEYLCEDCGTKFEKLLRRVDDATECPKCGEKHLSAQYSTFSAHANGAPKDVAPMPSCCGGGMCGDPSGFCSNN